MESRLISYAYAPCRLCPRNCAVDRLAGEKGYCGETSDLRIAAAVIHKGEEPPITGTGGSGTIFVSGCNLGCNFCQNYQVSQGSASLGKTVSPQEFTKICEALRDNGAENINIVTGSHAIPALAECFTVMRKSGTQIPVLWNSSAYETTEALELLEDHVDIYLPDLKTLDSEIAGKFFNAPDYPSAACAAILKMIGMANKKNPGKSRDNVIVRHLVLPGYLESTKSVIKWFADNAKDHAQLSLMTQYTPIPGVKGPMPDKYLQEDEYRTVIDWLDEFEIEEGFCQELVTGSDWLPDFKHANPFPSELSIPVWHC